MSINTQGLEPVDQHEVQYAIVTLGRDKEFTKLMDQELPWLEGSLKTHFNHESFIFTYFLYKSSDRYYLLIELKLNDKDLILTVLLNDSGPAFVIQGTDQKSHSLLSAKRVKETLLDLILDKFDTAMN